MRPPTKTQRGIPRHPHPQKNTQRGLRAEVIQTQVVQAEVVKAEVVESKDIGTKSEDLNVKSKKQGVFQND